MSSLRLDQLLKACTVKIDARNGSYGTGFFFAPGLILTCYHVVSGKVGELVTVLPENFQQSINAKVEFIFPEPIDLAILLTENISHIPCVYFGEEIQPRDPCFTYGYTHYSNAGNPYGDPVTLECEGIAGGVLPKIKLKAGQILPGMSGAPLLNYHTGKVCGVIKSTRDARFDLGGEAIPVEIIFQKFPEYKQLQRDFHQQDTRWRRLLAQDIDALDSDWTYLDDASKRFSNYWKTLLFLGKTLIQWLILGWKAPNAFPFSTIRQLITHTLRCDLGQEIKKQRKELTRRLNLEVNLEMTGQARLLNELESQASLLNHLIGILIQDQKDLISKSRLSWANEIIYEQKELIREAQEKPGNFYPELNAVKRRFPFLDQQDRSRYIRTDKVVSKIISRYGNSNLVLWHSIVSLVSDFLEFAANNPRFYSLYASKLVEFILSKSNDVISQLDCSVDDVIFDLEEGIKNNSDLKVLQKIHFLVQAAVGERIEGGEFRAWSHKGKYHFHKKCRLYPERAKPSEMKQILCYETRNEAEKKHTPCTTCNKLQKAERSPFEESFCTDEDFE